MMLMIDITIIFSLNFFFFELQRQKHDYALETVSICIQQLELTNQKPMDQNSFYLNLPVDFSQRMLAKIRLKIGFFVCSAFCEHSMECARIPYARFITYNTHLGMLFMSNINRIIYIQNPPKLLQRSYCLYNCLGRVV